MNSLILTPPNLTKLVFVLSRQQILLTTVTIFIKSIEVGHKMNMTNFLIINKNNLQLIFFKAFKLLNLR